MGRVSRMLLRTVQLTPYYEWTQKSPIVHSHVIIISPANLRNLKTTHFLRICLYRVKFRFHFRSAVSVSGRGSTRRPTKYQDLHYY